MNGKVKSASVQSSASSKANNFEHRSKPHRSRTTSLAQVVSSKQKNRSSKKHVDSISQVGGKRNLHTLALPNGLLNRSELDPLTLKGSETSEELELNASTESLQPSEKERFSNNREESLHKLRLAMSSAEAFKRGAAKGEEKIVNVKKKKYYQKAIAIMVTGGLFFSAGIVFAVLHFADYFTQMQMLGPVCLAIGLLMIICGVVWLPIIKTKLKRQESVMSRTFTL